MVTGLKSLILRYLLPLLFLSSCNNNVLGFSFAIIQPSPKAQHKSDSKLLPGGRDRARSLPEVRICYCMAYFMMSYSVIETALLLQTILWYPSTKVTPSPVIPEF